MGLILVRRVTHECTSCHSCDIDKISRVGIENESRAAFNSFRQWVFFLRRL